MVVELVLTVVLLAGAGFMMRNFVTMYRLDLGIDTSRLLTMALALPDRKYPALEQRLAFYERLEERLRSNPKIENVTVTNEAVDMNLANEAVPVTTAEPAAPAPEETAPAPPPAKRSFPWGVLGLLGLVGLFGRRSRTG